MFRKISGVVTLIVAVLMQPLAALAEAAPTAPSSPSWSWPGSWFMWGDGWSFWWLCPLMMLAMMLMCGIMCFGRRPWSDGPHR